MVKNYYHILGVDADATQDQIKSAYRSKAKELHPDRFTGGSQPFRTLQEAYEVLCDPARRHTYDSELARAQRVRRPVSGITPQPLRRRYPPAEPLVPTRGSVRPQDAFFDPSPAPPLQELRGHLWGTGRAQEIHLQVSLTRDQARRGGTIRLPISLVDSCPACQGQGGDWFFVCPHCLGEGAVVDETPVEIVLPAHLVHGATARVSLRRPGVRDVVLILHFAVGRW
jgi:molecular chaperone DnaJ